MAVDWLAKEELAAWMRVVAVLELLPAGLDAQLRHDAGLTSFEYYVLAMLSEAPDLTLRMTTLAAQTNATLSRLSHVVRRLEAKALVRRSPCPEDRRATNAMLTEVGRAEVERAAPGHVSYVRQHVIDVLSPAQLQQLSAIADALLSRLDPGREMAGMYGRHDEVASGLASSVDPGAI